MLINFRTVVHCRGGASTVSRFHQSALLGLIVATTLCWPAIVSGNPFAAATNQAIAVGMNHPASGAYSPVEESSWATATWGLGATFADGEGSTLQVGVYSEDATLIVLEIYLADPGADATYDYTLQKGSDNVWRAAVALVPGKTFYAFRAWGPNWTFSPGWKRGNSGAGFVADCDAQGNRFNPNKVLFDPYARELSHGRDTAALQIAHENSGIFGTGGADVAATQTYSGPCTQSATVDRRTVDTGRWAPKAVAFVDNTGVGTKPRLAARDAIIYETHLKGLTAHPSSVNLRTLLAPYSGFSDAANVPDQLRGTYAGAAYMAGYLKDLGINTVELLPVQETNNEMLPADSPSNLSNGNYWSYMTYGFFAPDRRYAANRAPGGPTSEFKQMIAAFHNAGLEVYLDVVYNHTAEGGLWDNTGAAAEVTCFRGLDNRSYYTLSGANNDHYFDTTGCGNNLNGGSAIVQKLVTDSLAYWANVMGVDGFRFDLAVELGRNGSSGFSKDAGLLQAILSTAGADGFKVIAEPWDTSDGGEIGGFPRGWAEWNGNYRDALRRYLLGDLEGANGVGYADAFYGDYNEFNAAGGPQESVNLVVAHDGFTMTDLASYGSPTNNILSWPFGPSDGGATDNKSSTWGGNQIMRRQVIRDIWTFQVLSRGIPMIEWGDEFGRTVNGNNNAYNIDSVATWNNYSMIGSGTPDGVSTADNTGKGAPYDNNLGTFAGGTNGNFAFLQFLLKLRAGHVAFRQQDYVSMAISFTNPDGSGGFNEYTNPSARIYVKGSQVGDDDFVVMSNMAGSPVSYTVPAAPGGTHWIRVIDTNNWAESTGNCWGALTGTTITGTYNVGNQTIVVLEAVHDAPPASS